MKISPHKTKSVFEQYNITDEKDLKQAAEWGVSASRSRGGGTISRI